jgi:glucuronate isomerase
MSKNFIHDDFMLTNKAASELYHRFAADQPIIDYHNHLSPSDIAGNRKFDNLFDMWIDHDHYKWRAMRANGVDESLVTGDGSPKEKFLAFAATVPHTLRNPLYHWTHLELKRYFDIDEMLCSKTAESIWENACDQIANRSDLQVRGILEKFKVAAL